MKKVILVSSLIALCAASVAQAQTIVGLEYSGRSLVTTFTTPTGAGSWNGGGNTFSGTPGTDDTWAQMLLFDVESVAGGAAAFNAATEFELDLTGMTAGQQYSIFASVGNVAVPANGGAAVATSTLVSGTTLATGQTSQTIALAANTALNNLLAANDFTANQYVYIGFMSEVRGSASEPNWGGAGLTAIPEPSTYALLAGCLALASVMVRRRRS